MVFAPRQKWRSPYLTYDEIKMFIHIIYLLWYNLAESSIENFINYFSVKQNLMIILRTSQGLNKTMTVL